MKKACVHYAPLQKKLDALKQEKDTLDDNMKAKVSGFQWRKPVYITQHFRKIKVCLWNADYALAATK